MVPPDAVLLTNQSGNRKFIDEVERRFQTLRTLDTAAERTVELVERHEQMYLVLLDRNDSRWWKQETQRNADYLAALSTHVELLTDIRPNPTDRMRIWRLSQSAGS